METDTSITERLLRETDDDEDVIGVFLDWLRDDDDELPELPFGLIFLLYWIWKAITNARRIRMRYEGVVRLLALYRLWRQIDGSYLLEAYQVDGGSPWGAASGKKANGQGGYEGWTFFRVEALEFVSFAGGPFEPRSDFRTDPQRNLGELLLQVE